MGYYYKRKTSDSYKAVTIEKNVPIPEAVLYYSRRPKRKLNIERDQYGIRQLEIGDSILVSLAKRETIHSLMRWYRKMENPEFDYVSHTYLCDDGTKRTRFWRIK